MGGGHERLRWLLCLASLVLSYLEVKGRWRIPRGGRLPTAGVESPCRKQNIEKRKMGAPTCKTQGPSQRATQRRWGGGVPGVFEVSPGRGQDSLCSSLGHCGDHMGKQDEAVTCTLCVVDLDAWTCNGSPPRNISAFKGVSSRGSWRFSHVGSAARQREGGTSVTGRVGEIGLQCIFFCSLRGASCLP